MHTRNVTGLVDALEGAGFVTRSPHPTDRRATVVSLTPQGTNLVTDWHHDRDHGTPTSSRTRPQPR